MRTWIEIDKKRIEKNYQVFRKLISPKCKLMAIVKSNAYGHSLVDFSLLVNDLVDCFGVDSIVEAERLRESGIKKPILVLGYTVNEKIESAIKKDITLTIPDFNTLKIVNKLPRKPKIHLKIDTGMHRQGFFLSEIPKLIKNINFPVEGIYTHFAAAKSPLHQKATIKQCQNFQKAIEMFESSGFKNLIKHASATSGTITFPQAHFDMVRIGIGLYGIWPSSEVKEYYQSKIKLSPVLSWKTIITQIKKLPKNSYVGYNFSEKVKRDSKIAILPIGYWHGYPYSLSSVGYVVVRKQKAKVIGRVCMDMTMVDVTDIKGVKVGDNVSLIDDIVTSDDIAKTIKTSTYEVITRINPKIKRIIV